MLSDSIQSVLDDELSYVAFATVNIYRKERGDEPPAVNNCYVCLGGKRIYLFAKDLSEQWESRLYLTYQRLARVTCYSVDDSGVHLQFADGSSKKEDIPEIYLSECADRKSLLVQLQILRINDYIDREKRAPSDAASDSLKIESYDITKDIPQWIVTIQEKKEVLKPEKAKKHLEARRQEKYDSVNLIKANHIIKMETFVAPDHNDQYRLDGWIKPDEDDIMDSGNQLVRTDARFNPNEDTRVNGEDATTNPWHAYGRNTFRTKRLSHFSSYFTGAGEAKIPNDDSWLLEVWTSAPAEQTFTNDSGTEVRAFVNEFLAQLSSKVTELKLLGKLTSVGKGRNSSAYKADTAQWECWQLQARLWTASADVKPSLVQPTQAWSTMPSLYCCRDVIIYSMRRSFIPPFFDKSQDFIVVMFSPKLLKPGHPIDHETHRKNLTQLRRVSENIVDSLEATQIPEIDTVVAKAKAEALTLSRAEFRWFQKFLKVTPPHVEKYKHFATSIKQMLSKKFKHLKDMQPSVSWKLLHEDEVSTTIRQSVAFRQQNVLERHAQILKDPSNGAKMVKVQIARSFPPSDNCLLLQLDEPKNKLQFLLERTRMDLSPPSEEFIAREMMKEGKDECEIIFRLLREEKRSSVEGGSKRLLEALTKEFETQSFHRTLPEKTLAKKRLYAFLAFCLDGYFNGFDVFTLMSDPTKMDPFSKSTQRRIDFLLENMLHLRKASDIFRWKPLTDTVQNVSLMEDLDFNYEVMCRLLRTQYISKRLYKQSKNYRIYVQFLVRLLAYCVRSPVAERRTLRLQSVVSIELVEVSRHLSAPLQKSDNVAKITLGSTQQRNQTMLLALPKILEFLRRISSDSLRTYMIVALANFCFKNATIKRAVMQSKGASEIVNCLRSPDEDLVRHACRLLVNLTSDSETKSQVNGHYCQVIYSYKAMGHLLRLIEPSDYRPRYRPVSLVTEVVSVLRNLASERDSGQLRDAVVLGLGTEEKKLDIGTVTVYRVIRLLCVDLLLRRPSDHLSGEDAIPTDVQVEAMLNTVCELLIKITYQHSVYKHQVGLLAIDPLLYLMEPPKSSEAAMGMTPEQEQRFSRLKQLHPHVNWDRLVGVPTVNMQQKHNFNLMKKMLTLINFLVFEPKNIPLFDQRGLFLVLLQIRKTRKCYGKSESVIGHLCDQISARARTPAS